jgi:hypothetical protein
MYLLFFLQVVLQTTRTLILTQTSLQGQEQRSWGDLEYVTPVAAAARPEGSGFEELVAGCPQSACDQDIAQLELLTGDVLRL